jgi:hypothetical protein
LSAEVLVSSTVRDVVAGSGIGFEDRRTRELRGIPGRWRLFAVRQTDPNLEPLRVLRAGKEGSRGVSEEQGGHRSDRSRQPGSRV